MGYWRYFYPRSRPKRVRGGIKARTKRGEIGETWWAKRFLEVLDGFASSWCATILVRHRKRVLYKDGETL